MNTHPCCQAARNSRSRAGGPRSPTTARRFVDAVGWVASGALFALVPKCPACLAAYVAVWTGVGISFTTASYLRTSLLILCATSLSFLAARYLSRSVVFRKAFLRLGK